MYAQQQNTALTRRYADQSLALGDSLQLRDLQQDALEILAKTERELGHEYTALQYENRRFRIRDSILGAAQVRAVADLAQTDKTELQEDNFGWLLIGTAAAILLGFSVYFWFRKRKDNSETVAAAGDSVVHSELNRKNRELAAAELSIEGDTAFFEEILDYIGELKKSDNRHALFKLEKSIERHHQSRKDLTDTVSYFREVYPQFFKTLKQQYPDLTNNDMRHAAYLRMGLSAKEVASVMRVKTNTVEIARYRLKKRLGLEKKEKLRDWLLNFRS